MNIAVKLSNLSIIGASLTDLDSDWRWHLSIIDRPRPPRVDSEHKKDAFPSWTCGPTLPSFYRINRPARSLNSLLKTRPAP